MADPFVGEIKIWAMSWAPSGWALCNGAILPISQNQALYSLIGKVFGGDGVTNFALPDLRGRTPIGSSITAVSGLTQYAQGASGGLEAVTLAPNQVPPHTHSIVADTGLGNQAPPTGAYFASVASNGSANFATYASATPTTPLYAGSGTLPGTLSTAGGGGAHSNIQPLLVTNFTICLRGLYPTRP